MGEISEALRANLRELAQADARLLRELGSASSSAPGEMASGSPLQSAAALSDGLDKLGLKELKDLCKKKGHKGFSRFKKEELIALLRGGRTGTQAAPAALPAPAVATLAPGQPGIETRLNAIEALLQRIATHLGVE